MGKERKLTLIKQMRIYQGTITVGHQANAVKPKMRICLTCWYWKI